MFSGASQTVSDKHVLIMDEVDGMAGNEDRGGIQVFLFVKKKKINKKNLHSVNHQIRVNPPVF